MIFFSKVYIHDFVNMHNHRNLYTRVHLLARVYVKVRSIWEGNFSTCTCLSECLIINYVKINAIQWLYMYLIWIFLFFQTEIQKKDLKGVSIIMKIFLNCLNHTIEEPSSLQSSANKFKVIIFCVHLNKWECINGDCMSVNHLVTKVNF